MVAATHRTGPGEASRAAPILVRPVHSGRDLDQFVRLPWSIYRDDAAWIPPLLLERKLHLSSRNPFFEHGRWQGWIACRGQVPVGRIAAHVDDLHRARYGADTGHFGLLEGEDDPAIFTALFRAAENWLAQAGSRRISGPFSFSINQECGLLVDGFETPPAFLLSHNPRWYGPHVEALGYLPVKDLLAYWVNVDFEAPDAMRILVERYSKRIRIRCLRRNEMNRELEVLRDIFNDAWSNNWGFVPFTRSEFAELGSSLRLFVRDEYIQVAEVDGDPSAFVVALPNLHEVFRELNGSVLPFGLAKLLWRVWRRRISTGRVPLMGVRRRFQGRPLGVALAFLVIDAVRQELFANGIREVDLSWILEDNSGTRSILESFGSRQYKRFRIYEKQLCTARD
jgi:hypothetical protein